MNHDRTEVRKKKRQNGQQCYQMMWWDDDDGNYMMNRGDAFHLLSETSNDHNSCIVPANMSLGPQVPTAEITNKQHQVREEDQMLSSVCL